MKKVKRKIRQRWGLILVILLSFAAIKPLLSPGFFPIHDNTQVVRVFQMAQALKDGQFPVRWVADLGYGFGYPIFNFYAPFAYYLGGFLDLIGFDSLASTKLMIIFSVFLSGLSMYWLAREFWGEPGGVISGLFYVFAPYRAVDLYVRGAVGELWAMAFLPLVLLAVYKISTPGAGESHPRWLGVTVGSLCLAAVILSHNLTAMMFLPFLILAGLVAFIFSKHRRLFLIDSSLFLILALALTAFYWLPALVEMDLTKVAGQIGGGADWRDHFVYLDQLWASPWGFGGSAPGRLDGISFMVGKLHLGLALAALLLAGYVWVRDKVRTPSRWPACWRGRPKGLLEGGILLLTSIFFTNQVSSPIWELIKPMAYIQYPWRWLIFATLASSFLAGSLFQDSPGPSRVQGLSWVLVGGVVLGLLGLNLKFFQPQFIYPVKAVELTDREKIIWETSQVSDEYLPRDFLVPENKTEAAWGKLVVVSGKAAVETLASKVHRYEFKVKAEGETEILINIAYFPGWQVRVDSQLTDFQNQAGKMMVKLPPGEHDLSVRLRNTPVRNLANLISLLVVSGILIGFVNSLFLSFRS